MAQIENNKAFSSVDILYKMWMYRKVLLIVTAAVLVISTVVSFLITPLYKSSVVLLPAPSTTISKSFKNTSMYGEEEETERLLQVLSSDDLREFIVKKYSLYKHYDIDTTARDKKTRLIKEYSRLITVSRTQYMAIEVEVLDHNSDTAAMLANDIARYSDTVMNIMEKRRTQKAFEIITEEYSKRWNAVKESKDSLQKLMQKGVVDFESQARVYNDAIGKATSKGNRSGAQAVKIDLKSLQDYGSNYIVYRDFIHVASEHLATLLVDYSEAQMDAEKMLPHSFVVNQATVSDRKAFPNRILIIFLSTISAFVLCFLSLIVMEAINNFKKQEAQQA